MVCAACKPAFFQKVSEGVTSGTLVYAGFWTRFGAKFIDGMIMWVVGMMVGVAMGASAVSALRGGNPETSIGINAAMQILQIIIAASYGMFFLGAIRVLFSSFSVP